jgi:hypothetical protein
VGVSSASSTKAKNEWICTLTSPCAFIPCSGNFTCILLHWKTLASVCNDGIASGDLIYTKYF